nr:MAG TPA: hypothetical protein [Caudoviricetes sp.]
MYNGNTNRECCRARYVSGSLEFVPGSLFFADFY